jgi:peptidyl-prolyl cis-trans isomerase D
MLTDIKRKASGIAGTIVVFMLALIVCLGGVSYYSKSNNNDVTVVKVNGDAITKSSLQHLYEKNKFSLLKSNPGLNLTQDQLSSMREELLDNLIIKRLKQQYATNNIMLVPSNVLNSYVLSLPYFQEDDKFSEQLYLSKVVQSFGSEEAYLAQLSEDLLVAQMKIGLAESTFMLPYELTDLTYLLNQQRDIKYLEIDPQKMPKEKIKPATIKEYYQAHKTDFTTGEKVKVKYVILDKAVLADSLKPTEQTLRNYFEKSKAAFTTEQRFKFNVYEVSSDPENAGLSSGQQQLLEQQILPNVGSTLGFAEFVEKTDNIKVLELKHKNFQSKNKINPDYLATLSKLKDGAFGVLKTDNGFVVLKLLGVEGGLPQYAKVKNSVLATWKNEQAEKKYASLNESLTELAYTSDNLEQIASELNLKIKTSSLFSRDVGSDSVSNNILFRNTAFSEDVLANNLNSSVLKINDTQVIVMHIAEHIAATELSLAVAKPKIENIIGNDRQLNDANLLAKKCKKYLAAGQPIDPILKKYKLSWKTIANIKLDGIINRVAMEIRDDVFAMPRPTDKLSSWGNYKLKNGNMIVVGLTNVHTANPLTVYPGQIHEDYARYMKGWEYASYERHLKETATIEHNHRALNNI